MRRSLIFILAATILAAGCTGLRKSPCGPCVAADDDKKCHYDCKAKTLLSWGVCKDDEKDKDGEKDKEDDKKDNEDDKKETGKEGENGKEKDAEKSKDKAFLGGDVGFARVGGRQQDTSPLALVADPSNPMTPSAAPPTGTPPPVARPSAGGSMSPTGSLGTLLGAAEPNTMKVEQEEPDTIVTDRPDFTEASTTVGRGRIQLESGYTYFRDKANGETTHTHSYPEILLRVGAFADWFEFRFGQNFGAVHTYGATGQRTDSVTGAYDLYLGTKIALTEQKGFMPELAMIFQATVPTGTRSLTGNGNQVLPGISLLYSWELNDKWSLAGSVLGNAAVDDDRHKFTLFASSLSLGHSFTDKLGGYFEYFGFYPHGAVAADTKPEYYLNGGFTYQVTNNFQLDIRAGFGLNRAAADFFSGVGFAVRY